LPATGVASWNARLTEIVVSDSELEAYRLQLVLRPGKAAPELVQLAFGDMEIWHAFGFAIAP